MTIGSCHCGAVRIEVPGAPDWVASCNCSICRKLGWLVAYYTDDGSARIEGETSRYATGDMWVDFHHCPICGCTTHWSSRGESFGRVGINARLLDSFAVVLAEDGQPICTFDGAALDVRLMDNADS